jgi:hypothetical protein
MQINTRKQLLQCTASDLPCFFVHPLSWAEEERGRCCWERGEGLTGAVGDGQLLGGERGLGVARDVLAEQRNEEEGSHGPDRHKLQVARGSCLSFGQCLHGLRFWIRAEDGPASLSRVMSVFRRGQFSLSVCTLCSIERVGRRERRKQQIPAATTRLGSRIRDLWEIGCSCGGDSFWGGRRFDLWGWCHPSRKETTPQ